MRSVTIFGATGSIGENTFDLLIGRAGPTATAPWR
jgi:1-deoxy-D-xylulose 5-phosphate reductoisomerase